MAFHHLGNLLEFALHLPVHRPLFKAYAYVGAGVVAQSARIHLIAGAGYDLHVYQPLDSLMYRCTRDSADHCDIFGRYAGIAHNDIQDLFVEIVY